MKNHSGTAGQLNLSERKSLDKAEKTTQAANDIMHAERKASDAKTARLKAARLARDAEAPIAEPKKPPKPKARKAAGK